MTSLRDIYFLIFDRYGSERSLKLRYGITDNDIYDWLEQHGFYVARNSHANYHSTSESVNSTLNMDFLKNLPKGSIRDHAVGRFVKDLGYSTSTSARTSVPIRPAIGPTRTWASNG